MNISSSLKTVKSVITANSPVLLVGAAIAGVVTTGVLAAKGGYKARGIIDDAEADKGDLLTPVEKFQLTWLCYAAPAVTGATTIASVIGVHTIHTKRHAALAGLYAIATTKADEYSEKAEELLGAKKTQELNNKILQKSVDNNPIVDNEVVITDYGKELCYDEWSGRYFWGSVNKIEEAGVEVNRRLLDGEDVSLNDFYDLIGLPFIQSGLDAGWSGTKLRLGFGSTLTQDNRPAIGFQFQTTPRTGLNRVH